MYDHYPTSHVGTFELSLPEGITILLYIMKVTIRVRDFIIRCMCCFTNSKYREIDEVRNTPSSEAADDISL